jgi:hypothetical protein
MTSRRLGKKAHLTEGRKLLVKLLESTTQATVARSIGARQQYVCSWAAGASRPEAHYRDALARVYGIAPTCWYTAAEAKVARGESTPPPSKRTGTDG